MSERISRRHFVYFLVAALVASVFFSFFLRDTFRRYEAEARVAVIARTAAAAPARDLAANLVSFSQTDEYRRLFFDRLLERRGMSGGELSVSERTVQFDRTVAVRQFPSGSMLSIRGYSDDPETAREIAREAALSLFVFAGQYYNVKHEADFRIIGMMPGRYGIESLIPYVVSSISFGFGVVALTYLVAVSIPFRRETGRKRPIPGLDRKIFTPRRPVAEAVFARSEPISAEAETEPEGRDEVEEEEVVSSELESLLAPMADEAGEEERDVSEAEAGEASDAAEMIPGAPEEGTERIEEVETKAPKRSPIRSEKKGAAPSNLPGGMTEAEERFLNEFAFEDDASEAGPSESEEGGEAEDAMAEPESEAVSPPEPRSDSHEDEASDVAEVHHEPSEEEYRRRLNELLRG